MKQTHRAKHAVVKHVERFQELPAPARHTEARANRGIYVTNITITINLYYTNND